MFDSLHVPFYLFCSSSPNREYSTGILDMKLMYGVFGTDDTRPVVHCKFTCIKDIEVTEYMNPNKPLMLYTFHEN
jgi:hypothetical protein